MTENTRDTNGACSLSRYRQVIEKPWKQVQRDAVAGTSVDKGKRPILQIHVIPESAADATEDHTLLDTATRGGPVREAAPTPFNTLAPRQEQKPLERRILSLSDESSDEGYCSIEGCSSSQSSIKRQPRSATGTKDQVPTVIAGDCSEGEECYADGNSSDNDSESDNETYGLQVPSHKRKMRKWTSVAKGKFENMLLECIVNTDNITANYENIYIDRRTIDKVERITALGLKRPEAFSHGVLKNNKVTGAILYGPPGTGKTLLAKGVAKQSGFNMLAISTSEVWQKCHGDDEKMVKAIFSMARKMYPCIVFIDEADGLLGERKAGEKRHMRSMLNQFLMEWDGIMSGKESPFILLATNRPNDLDPAVLRRAPARIVFNLPTTMERMGILRLLLKDEKLGPDITITTLANMTPQYSGSDLKNLCVTAATECIGEQYVDTKIRVLTRRHFLSAMQTVKATGLGKAREQDMENFQNNSQEKSVRAEEE